MFNAPPSVVQRRAPVSTSTITVCLRSPKAVTTAICLPPGATANELRIPKTFGNGRFCTAPVIRSNRVRWRGPSRFCQATSNRSRFKNANCTAAPNAGSGHSKSRNLRSAVKSNNPTRRTIPTASRRRSGAKHNPETRVDSSDTVKERRDERSASWKSAIARLPPPTARTAESGDTATLSVPPARSRMFSYPFRTSRIPIPSLLCCMKYRPFGENTQRTSPTR